MGDEAFAERCREVGRWTTGFGLVALAVEVVIAVLYDQYLIDLLEIVLIFLGRGVAAGSAWALRWTVLLAILKAGWYAMLLGSWLVLVGSGLRRIDEHRLLVPDVLVLAAIGATLLLWCAGIAWRSWRLLHLHPEALGRGYRLLVATLLGCAVALVPLFAFGTRELQMVRVTGTRSYDLTVDGRSYTAVAILRAPGEWRHLGAVVIGEDAADRDVVAATESSRGEVAFADGTRAPVGSVLWRDAGGGLRVIGSAPDLAWIEEEGRLEALLGDWIRAQDAPSRADGRPPEDPAPEGE